MPEPARAHAGPEAMTSDLSIAEHHTRYRLVLDHVRDKRVLDVGCGQGWGSHLLQGAGARAVVGLDSSARAIEESRRRAPTCEFVEGDLAQMPFDDGDFDVVVCFGALECVPDPAAALDELARVLAPEGLLFVSSANPGVSPDYNPLHLHELAPQELVRAVSERLPEHALFRQHQALASVLEAESALDHEGAEHSRTWAGLAPNEALQSVVVGSRRRLPELTSWTCVAPMTQMHSLLDDRAALTEEVHDAQARLQRLESELTELTEERDEARDAAVRHHSLWQTTARQLDNQKAMAHNAARERDELATRLLEAQREAAGLGAPGQRQDDAELARLRRRVERLRARLETAQARTATAEAQLSEIRESTSWRSTRALRWVSRLAQR